MKKVNNDNIRSEMSAAWTSVGDAAIQRGQEGVKETRSMRHRMVSSIRDTHRAASVALVPKTGDDNRAHSRTQNLNVRRVHKQTLCKCGDKPRVQKYKPVQYESHQMIRPHQRGRSLQHTKVNDTSTSLDKAQAEVLQAKQQSHARKSPSHHRTLAQTYNNTLKRSRTMMHFKSAS